MDNEHTNHPNYILIVDDNPDNLALLIYALRRAEFEILPAENGLEALEVLSQYHVDLVLLDIMMPGMNGFELCEEIKGTPETKNIPVIFMTALSDTASKIRAFQAGAVDYVTKPLQTEEVIARVTAHITIGNLQSDLQTQNQTLQEEIAQRKQAEAELKTYATELAKRNEALDSFASTVAHDLKGPLGMIMNYIQFIQLTEELNPALQERLQIMLKTGHQMQQITDELLLLATVREDEVAFEALDMSALIHNTLDRLGYMIEEQDADVQFPPEWPIVIGYPAWVESAWNNYISNALKYGGTPPLIELGYTVQDDDQIQFWVKDNGPGIEKEAQSKLFTEFTRLTHENIKGHGLGLSIVKRMINKLGGQVGVESKVGQGSIFYFTLPRQT